MKAIISWLIVLSASLGGTLWEKRRGNSCWRLSDQMLFGWTASGEFAVQRCKSDINTTCRAQEVGGRVLAQVCSWCDSVWHHCRRLKRHRLLTLCGLYELEAEPSDACFCFGRGDSSRAGNGKTVGYVHRQISVVFLFSKPAPPSPLPPSYTQHEVQKQAPTRPHFILKILNWTLLRPSPYSFLCKCPTSRPSTLPSWLSSLSA